MKTKVKRIVVNIWFYSECSTLFTLQEEINKKTFNLF